MQQVAIQIAAKRSRRSRLLRVLRAVILRMLRLNRPSPILDFVGPDVEDHSLRGPLTFR
jgi:hypothetical protein